ncbi:MAG: redoxin domain-containing protein [Okeania sp. SIO2D1]|nr:redoxin domain-containing protein [Okeania sp. SIO2D1]
MELTKNLQQLQAEIQAQLPEDAKEKMNKAVVDLANSDIVDNSLKVGKKVPNFSLPNAVGKIVELNSLLAESPVVISFYQNNMGLKPRLLRRNIFGARLKSPLQK